MKLTHLLFLSIIILFTACSTPENNEIESDSLAKSTKTVIYEVSLEVDVDFTNWMGNIDQKKLIESIFNDVKNNKLTAYEPMSNTETTWSEIKTVMGAYRDTIDILNTETNKYETEIIESEIHLNEIKGIIFIEEWNLNTSGHIDKEVLGIAPVRYFANNIGDTIIDKKRIVFVTYYGDKHPPIFEEF